MIRSKLEMNFLLNVMFFLYLRGFLDCVFIPSFFIKLKVGLHLKFMRNKCECTFSNYTQNNK